MPTTSLRPARQRLKATALLCATALVLQAGCSLPRSAPVESKITKEAAAEDADFAILPVDRATVARVAKWPRQPGSARNGAWPKGTQGATTSLIAPGDRITLTVWESGDNPLLTSPAAKSVQLTDVAVSSNGTVFVPYIGAMNLRGLSSEGAREKVQTQMEGVLDQPQVQLSVNQGRQNTVDLVSGVAAAGSYPLPDRNFSILSLISQGGGIANTLRNPQVKLMRGGKMYTISAKTLMADPARDIVMQGGDKVMVEEDKRYFLALGAAASQKQIHFSQDELSALDAMALIGGVSANRANPEAILVMREYPVSAIRADGSGPSKSRMVFNMDLTTADGLFSARKFMIQPEDLVLVTESPINGVRAIMSLFGQSVGVVNSAENIGN